MTLMFDLIPEIGRFIPCPVDHLCQFSAKSVHSFLKHRVHEFGNGRTDGRTNKRTGGKYYASGQYRLADGQKVSLESHDEQVMNDDHFNDRAIIHFTAKCQKTK